MTLGSRPLIDYAVKNGWGMSKRNRRILAVVTLGGVLLVWFCGPKHRITEENYEQLSVGMTLEKASQILGGPPNLDSRLIAKRSLFVLRSSNPKSWKGNGLTINIDLDEHGKIVAKECCRYYEPSFFDEMIDWLCPYRGGPVLLPYQPRKP